VEASRERQPLASVSSDMQKGKIRYLSVRPIMRRGVKLFTSDMQLFEQKNSCPPVSRFNQPRISAAPVSQVSALDF
jgi:hypothetical protein